MGADVGVGAGVGAAMGAGAATGAGAAVGAAAEVVVGTAAGAESGNLTHFFLRLHPGHHSASLAGKVALHFMVFSVIVLGRAALVPLGAARLVAGAPGWCWLRLLLGLVSSVVRAAVSWPVEAIPPVLSRMCWMGCGLAVACFCRSACMFARVLLASLLRVRELGGLG